MSISSRAVVFKASNPPADQMVLLHKISINPKKEDKEGMKRRTRRVVSSELSEEFESAKLAKLISSVLGNAGLEFDTVGEGRKRWGHQLVSYMLR